MSTSEVRVSGQDAELVAVQAVAKALAPLDREACNRVLSWAGSRFVERGRMAFTEFDHDGFARFSQALAEAANSLGSISPIEVLRFAEYVKEMREAEDG